MADQTVPTPRSVCSSLARIVLGFEAVVMFLGTLVLWGLAAYGGAGYPPAFAIVAGVAAIVLLALAAARSRSSWAIWLGWMLQGAIVLFGLLNPAMFVVGAVFGGLWTYCMATGARIDRMHARRAAASNAEDHPDPDAEGEE